LIYDIDYDKALFVEVRMPVTMELHEVVAYKKIRIEIPMNISIAEPD